MKSLSIVAVALAVCSTAAVAQTGSSGGVDPSTKAMTPKADVSPTTDKPVTTPSQAQMGTTTPTTPSPAPGIPSTGTPSTSNPPSATSTQSPGALNPPTTSGAEAAARSKIEGAGYTGVKGLTMAPNGTWSAPGNGPKPSLYLSCPVAASAPRVRP